MSHFVTELDTTTKFTGLSHRNLYLLIVTMNGIKLPDLSIIEDLPGYLAGSVSEEAKSAFSDHEEFGCHLGFPDGDSAEIPYELSDLTEKINSLRHDQAAWLFGFLEGFMEAQQLRASR